MHALPKKGHAPEIIQWLRLCPCCYLGTFMSQKDLLWIARSLENIHNNLIAGFFNLHATESV